MSSVAARQDHRTQPTGSSTGGPDTAHQAALEALARREDGRRPRHSSAAAPPASAAPEPEGAACEPIYVDAHGREYRNPVAALITESNELLLGLIDDTQQHLESKLAKLENTIGALQNENKSLRLILENLRITQRGERGIDGDRGPPGRADCKVRSARPAKQALADHAVNRATKSWPGVFRRANS